MAITTTEYAKEKKHNIYTDGPKYIGVYLSKYYEKSLNPKYRKDLLKS